MTPFSIGQHVVTTDGDEGTITDIYTADYWGDLERRDYVVINLGGGCIIDLPAEEVMPA